MGLEADRVEVLLLELLYKTDYSNDFDREVRVRSQPSMFWRWGDLAYALACVYL